VGWIHHKITIFECAFTFSCHCISLTAATQPGILTECRATGTASDFQNNQSQNRLQPTSKLRSVHILRQLIFMYW
jgi:hypothetical protein